MHPELDNEKGRHLRDDAPYRSLACCYLESRSVDRLLAIVVKTDCSAAASGA